MGISMHASLSVGVHPSHSVSIVPLFFHSFLSFCLLTVNVIREGNKMHGDGMFVDSVGRQWKGKFYNGQGPGLHTLPANDAPETDLNKTPVAHQPSGKSAKSAGSAA